jgi:hypothetical protein
MIAPQIEEESYPVGCQDMPRRDFEQIADLTYRTRNMSANPMNLLRNSDELALYRMRDNSGPHPVVARRSLMIRLVSRWDDSHALQIESRYGGSGN